MNDEKKIIERLPGDLKTIAELVGYDGAIKIARRFSGTYISVPKFDMFIREQRDKAIREEYDRGNITARDLALKHGLSIRQIFNILGLEPEEDKFPTLPLDI